MPSSITRLRVCADRAVATMLPTRFSARAARAMEDPIRPVPISARREKRGGGIIGSSRVALSARLSHELRQRRNGEAVRLLAADAHAQRVGQSVGLDLAQNDAARCQQ